MFVQRHWIRQTFSYNKHFICKVLSRNNFGSQNLLICISITLIGTLCAPKKSDKLALYPYCAAWKNRCTESNRINHKQNVSALFSSALLLRRWAREIQKYVAVAAYSDNVFEMICEFWDLLTFNLEERKSGQLAIFWQQERAVSLSASVTWECLPKHCHLLQKGLKIKQSIS